MIPKLTLVGAGPGDPDLISLKGVKALQAADVVLYDALANKAILKHASNAKLVYVGKRSGKHSFTQQEINTLIVENAFNYGHVVRLKGGDPFVFGRGYEEIAHADAFGIPSEVVPGISSAISVPELQQIPLTHRGINESFWVITGTTSAGKLSKDVALAAQSTATVIILMGVKKLPQIVQLFKQHNKAELPIAIIQEGSTVNEKMAIATIDSIEEQVTLKQISSPAVIVIGEVVRLHSNFKFELLEEILNH
jgi:uroporphyrin-III C-methyltransferase